MIKLKPLLIENISSEVEIFEKGVKHRYPQISEFGIYYDESINALFLSDIYIKEEFKGQGIGSKVMEETIGFAKRLKLPVVLVPDSDDDQTRLIKFYQKFGFVINSGKNINRNLKIPSAVSMYKMPL